jgi:hypothetical protein
MFDINSLDCDEIRLITVPDFEAKIGGYDVGDEIEMVDATIKVIQRTKEIVRLAVWYE